MNKNSIHQELICKIMFAEENVKTQSIANLLIYKEAIDKELEIRGY